MAHINIGNILGQGYDTLNLYFDFNKYKLTTEHHVQLNTLLDKYSEVNYISICGHADTTGNALYNLELSRKRAVSVKNYLFEIGLDTLIRNFNYYGEGMAVIPLQKSLKKYSLGAKIYSDRRVETIAGGKRFDLNPVMPVAIKNPGPDKIGNDNIPPEIITIHMPVTNPPITSMLDNGIEITYPKGTFSNYIQGNIDLGESVIKVIDDIDQMEQNQMLSVCEDGKRLSSMVIICFDTIVFTNFRPDSAIGIKIPLNNFINCPTGKMKVYTSVKKESYYDWKETSSDYGTEQKDGSTFITIKTDSFKGCMNFAYPVDTPCFSPAKAILKLKSITLSHIYGFITNINVTYIPEKKDEHTYEIFQNENETTRLLFNMVARDNKNKIYNLRNFPLSLCKYDVTDNSYLLTKKDLLKFLKLR